MERAYQAEAIPPPDNIERLALSDLETLLSGLLDGGEGGTVEAVDTLICQAIHHRASDVHFEPWQDCVGLRYRLDGSLHAVAEIPKEYQERIIARIKVLADLVIYHREIPQDGRIDPSPERLNRALRISTFPTIYGEKVVIRILDPHQGLLHPTALGFDATITDGLHELIMRPQGTLLFTGPSSSGKTTTIYSLLRALMAAQDDTRNIVTIEDPVEYRLGRIAQTQINPNLDFTFEGALRSLLRQDPDVIMVGEIRDRETASTTIQAGLTGHLVISTIHSGTASGVFTRLLDMGVEPFLLASSVTGVLAQRLVRVNCEACVKPYKPSDRILEQFGIPTAGSRFMRGIGCDECLGIGFKGRKAIGELLVVNDEISQAILERSLTRKLQDTALECGMATLLENGVQRVRKGITTIEELRAVLPPPDLQIASKTSTAPKPPVSRRTSLSKKNAPATGKSARKNVKRRTSAKK